MTIEFHSSEFPNPSVFNINVDITVTGDSCKDKKMRLTKNIIFTEYETNDKLLFPKVVPLPRIIPDQCWPNVEDKFKLVRAESNLGVAAVQEAVKLDPISLTIVISTFNIKFIGEQVSLKIAIVQDLVESAELLIVNIDFVEMKDYKEKIFMPIPLSSRVIGAGVDAVQSISQD